MMKTITHFISSSGGARHSLASSALLILLSFLMLLPGVARAEESTYGSLKYSIGDDDKITITGLADESATEIEIPATIDGKDVIAIGAQAFQHSNNLSSVKFATDGKLKTIGKSAFAYCDQLRSKMTIPASVEEIGEGAFLCCNSLSSVKFAADSKLRIIGRAAFNACRELSSIGIPASVEEIGIYSFFNAGLLSVTFATDAKLEKIGDYAFSNCWNLSKVEIPASVKELGDNPFEFCDNLTYFILKYTPKSGDDISFYSKLLDANQQVQLLVSPSSIDVYKQGLPTYSDRILGYVVSEGLLFADDIANGGLTCFGFSSDAQRKLVIPAKVGEENVTSINNKAFYRCSLLSSVSFAADGELKTIGERAFQGTSLTSVSIPKSVETIGWSAFSDMNSLTSVSFATDGKLRTIDENAFGMTNLTSVCIPASVETIKGNVFTDCSFLTFVSFAADGNLKTIGNGAFINTALTDISIPASVENIESRAFAGCYYLSSVSFAKDGRLRSIGESAFGRTYITSVSIPATVETIGASLFEGASRLESVTFNRNVDSENNLENYASDIFSDCGKLKTIYVPLASKEAYSAQLPDYQDKFVVYETGSAQTLIDEKGVAEQEVLTVYDKNTLSYGRKVETADGEYATVCLPFAIDLSQTADVFEKVYVPEATMIHDQAHSTDGVERFILMLKEQEAGAEIPAGQPMIVKLAAGKDEFKFTNSGEVALQKDMQPSVFNMTVLDWDGTSGLMTENRQYNISYTSRYLEPIEASEDMNIWSFNDNGTFGPQTQGYLNPFRLFLHVEDLTATTQAKAYSISIGVGDDSTTGIREIIPADTIGASGSSKHDGIIYDLNGRKVGTADQTKSLPKGIYILNGKKMVIL